MRTAGVSPCGLEGSCGRDEDLVEECRMVGRGKGNMDGGDG